MKFMTWDLTRELTVLTWDLWNCVTVGCNVPLLYGFVNIVFSISDTNDSCCWVPGAPAIRFTGMLSSFEKFVTRHSVISVDHRIRFRTVLLLDYVSGSVNESKWDV